MSEDAVAVDDALAVTFLLLAQAQDGGWSYRAGGPAAVEPTAAALLALRDALEAAAAVERGAAWLKSSQQTDGGWGLNAADPDSAWHTAWAVLALAAVSPGCDACERGREWLLRVEPHRPDQRETDLLSKDAFGMDLSLLGWPWRPGEAVWVEPTALTLLALARSGDLSGVQRVEEGVRYLLDRRCPGGGWNVGSPLMFSQAMPPRSVPTAWTILALAALAHDNVAPEDLSVLRAEAMQDGGALAFGWSLLALRTAGEHDAGLARLLEEQAQEDGSWDANPFHTAVALLARRGAL